MTSDAAVCTNSFVCPFRELIRPLYLSSGRLGSRSALAKTQTLAYGKLEGRTSLGSAKYRNAITPGNYERMKHDMHDRP